MSRFEGFRGDVVATLPESVPAGLALVDGNGVQFFLVEVCKAQVRDRHRGRLRGAAARCRLAFLNPVSRMKLVEVIQAPRTACTVVQALASLSERMGYREIVTFDSPEWLGWHQLRGRGAHRGLSTADLVASKTTSRS